MGEEFSTWKQHFIQQARGLIPHERSFYKVSSQKGKGESANIKMVTPTEQIVERAKASLDQSSSVYDPVTGIMQRTQGRHNKAISSRKHKRKTVKKRSVKSKKRKTAGRSLKRKKKTPTKKRKPNKTRKSTNWWK